MYMKYAVGVGPSNKPSRHPLIVLAVIIVSSYLIFFAIAVVSLTAELHTCDNPSRKNSESIDGSLVAPPSICRRIVLSDSLSPQKIINTLTGITLIDLMFIFPGYLWVRHTHKNK